MRRLMMFAVVTSMFTACGVSREEYNAKEMEAQNYQKQLQDESGKTVALEQKVKMQQTQITTLQKQLADSNNRLAATSSTAAAAQAEAGDLKERQAAVLNSKLMFSENSSKLSTEAKRSLDTVAEALGNIKDKAVLVAAYTDDSEAGGKTGSAKRWQLSTARATEVAKYLTTRGVDPKMIGVAGFGESRPLAPNDSAANKAMNRRVEIALTPTELNLKSVDVNPATLNK